MITSTATITTLLSIVGLAFYYFTFSKKKKSASSTDKKRAMSFSSMTMIRGSFPSSCQMSEPIINILTMFNKLPSDEKTKEAFSQLFEMFRFRAIPVFSKETKQWEFHESSSPNINDHIVTSIFATEKDCYDEIERVTKTSFDHMKNKPAWIFHRIVNQGSGKSFMLLRVHHVIGDGIALVLAIDRVFTNSKGEKVRTVLPGSKYDANKNNNVSPSSPSSSASPSSPSASFPPSKDSIFGQILRVITSFLRVISLATSNYDSDIAFSSSNKSQLAMNINQQKVIYFPNISLDYVKALKTKAGATVNDIMLGAMTGAIRRYCLRVNDPLMKSNETLQMRALLPVSFPRPESELNDSNHCLRNLWAFVSAPMPINEKTSQGRIKSSMSIMEGLKRSYEAIIQLWLMNNILKYAPLFVIHDTCQKTFTRHSLVFSNVPGPQDALYLCQEELIGIQVIFPNILPQTIILSYNGTICGNLVVDATIVKNSEILQETYVEEMLELGRVYNVDTTKMLR